MLKSMLSCYDEDGEVVTGGNEMQTIQSMLCSHLFVERHSWKKLCRDLRHFVSDCVVELEHRVPMFKVRGVVCVSARVQGEGCVRVRGVVCVCPCSG